MKKREEALRNIEGKAFDVCVIGGGATGAGSALDAQLRGLKTVLLDAGDFAGATSSMSTKIVHGGVRYLEEAVEDLDPAQYHVVTRALHERIHMLKNAPHLTRPMEFVVPCYHWSEVAYYDIGLKFYDWTAGRASLFPSHFLSATETIHRNPMLKNENLVGSVAYADGQFDDARYNITLVRTFTEAGGEALNYARVTKFGTGQDGKLSQVEVEDQCSHHKFTIQARAFINATGPFADTVRKLANPGLSPRMRPSKGIHILFPLDVMPSQDALLIPKTDDGRVLFAVPWMGRLLVGTTEKEVTANDELYVTKDEIDYLLQHLNRYLKTPASAGQVVSGIAGARPLVSSGDRRDTKKLVRDDVLEVDPQTGLISMMGGKWTTHRAMGEDTIDAVQEYLGQPVTESPTRDHLLWGGEGYTPTYWTTLSAVHGVSEETAKHLAMKFGTKAPEVLELAAGDEDLAKPIVEGLAPIRAEVAYCTLNEMAVTIEDVLFRRLGLQLYSWRCAIKAAPIVASILKNELGWTKQAAQSEAEQYVSKINRYLCLAGLSPEQTTSPAIGTNQDSSISERSMNGA